MNPELQPVRSTQNAYGKAIPPVAYGSPDAVADARSSDGHRVLRNSYLLLAASLVPTVIGAAIGTNLDLTFMRTSPMISFFAILGIFYGWIFAIEKNKDSGVGVGLLLGFTLFMGLLLGPLLQRVLGFSNGIQLVMMAAGGTAAVFFGMAAIATTTKRDFSFMGNFLMVGAIVIMLAVVGNVFFASPLVHLVLLGAFVLFSSLMILYVVNAVVRGGETNYISVTLSLYVSIYNLFSSLLQLLGFAGGNND